MKSAKLTLKSVDTQPERDPYQGQADAATYTQLYLDPRAGTYGLTQQNNTNDMTMAEYHQLILTARIEGHPDEAQARHCLTSPEALALLQGVIDGYSTDYNDQADLVGSLTEAAEQAWDEIKNDLNDLEDNGWSLWDTEEWLSPIYDQITMTTTRAELEAMASDSETAAKDEKVVLSDNIFDALYARWAYNHDGSVTTGQAAHWLGMETSHVRRMVLDGKIPAKKLGRDWIITTDDLKSVERERAQKTRRA